MVVQVGAAPPSTAGASREPAEPPVPDDGRGSLDGAAPPPIADPLPEQEVTPDGWQVNPLPHSASALHGSCHLKAQVDSVFVVHIGSACGGAGGHSVFGGHGATAAPPVHSMIDRWWQTIPSPQSESFAQAFGSQL